MRANALIATPIATVALVLAASMGAAPALAQDAESQVYAAVKTCVGLNAYLRGYPAGRFRADAQKRIAAECGGTTPATPKPAAPKPASPAPVSTPKASASGPSGGSSDPCRQARADWNQISATTDANLLRTFLASAPAACTVQRAQAQTKLDGLQSAATEEKRRLWNGVPEFEGIWVLEPGTNSNNDKGCGNFPWRYSPNGALIRRTYGNNTTRDMKVVTTTPPTLAVTQNNKGGAVMEGQRMRIIDPEGKTACYMKRQ